MVYVPGINMSQLVCILITNHLRPRCYDEVESKFISQKILLVKNPYLYQPVLVNFRGVSCWLNVIGVYVSISIITFI